MPVRFGNVILFFNFFLILITPLALHTCSMVHLLVVLNIFYLGILQACDFVLILYVFSIHILYDRMNNKYMNRTLLSWLHCGLFWDERPSIFYGRDNVLVANFEGYATRMNKKIIVFLCYNYIILYYIIDCNFFLYYSRIFSASFITYQ